MSQTSQNTAPEVDLNEILRQYNEDNFFAQLLGIKITKLEIGYAEGEVSVVHDHINTNGYAHGGVMYTLADTVTGAASKTCGKKTVTLEGKLNYIRAVKGGSKIRAVARSKHTGRTTSVYECDILDENGKLAATGIFTYYAVPDFKMGEPEKA